MTSTMPETLTRGDRTPTPVITIGDERDDADFSSLTTDDVWFRAEMNGVLVINGHPDSIEPSVDNKSLTVTREWQDTETDVSGRMYIWVTVDWPTGPQTFPESPLILDIRRAAGDD